MAPLQTDLSDTPSTAQETFSTSEQAAAATEIKKLGGKVSLNKSGEVIEVSLNVPQITDAGLQYLKGLTSLTNLDLRYTPVTDAELEHLKGLTSLDVLGLDGTKITDAGLAHLKGLTSLHNLHLGYTRITDAGLKHLLVLESLQYLEISDTSISSDGVALLKRALPSCDISARGM